MQDYVCRAPTSREETFHLLEQEETRLIAGGTDLLLLLWSGEVQPEILVDLCRLPEPRYVQCEGGSWIDTFAEYLIPAALDCPRIEATFVEYPEATRPWGAKGRGERGTVPTASAFANAVTNAAGVRITELPIEPEALITRRAPRERT